MKHPKCRPYSEIYAKPYLEPEIQAFKHFKKFGLGNSNLGLIQ